MAPGGKDIEAATLFQKIRVKRIYGPLTAEYPVRVDFTEYGRTVFATDNLQPGIFFYSNMFMINYCPTSQE